MQKAESLSFPTVIGSGGRGQSLHNEILIGAKPFKLLLLELYTGSVFFGRYRSVFLGIYHTDTEGKLGQYFWYQKIGGSPSKNWREPPFSQEGGASAPSLYTLPSF